jgi:antirestriction protein ArdC
MEIPVYTSGRDAVVMRRREAFDSPEFYYSVLFHELTHYADFRIMPRCSRGPSQVML